MAKSNTPNLWEIFHRRRIGDLARARRHARAPLRSEGRRRNIRREANDPYPILAAIHARVRIYPDVWDVLEPKDIAHLPEAAMWEVARNSIDNRGNVHFHRFDFNGWRLVLTAYNCADDSLEIEIATHASYLPVGKIPDFHNWW